jgi:hypothetical protein
MKLFHWGLLLRYMVYGVLPLIVGFALAERWLGPGSSGLVVLVLALILPFVALGWLGYQHLRHHRLARRKQQPPPRKPGPDP